MALFANSRSEFTFGYDREQVEEIASVIDDISKKTGKEIAGKIQNEIVVPVSMVWQGEEALKYFADFSRQVKKNLDNIASAFDNFRYEMQRCGEALADETGGTRPILDRISHIDMSLDIKIFWGREDDGDVFTKKIEGAAITNKLPRVKDDIKSALKTFEGQLDARTAFLGHGQREALAVCFKTINEEVDSIFAYLSDNALFT